MAVAPDRYTVGRRLLARRVWERPTPPRPLRALMAAVAFLLPARERTVRIAYIRTPRVTYTGPEEKR